MENHRLGTNNDKICADSSTGNTPQFIWPIRQNRLIIWDLFEKSSHHMSIVHVGLLWALQIFRPSNGPGVRGHEDGVTTIDPNPFKHFPTEYIDP